MARSAEDLAAAIDVLADRELPRARFKDLKGVRIFVCTSHPKTKTAKGIVDAIEAAAARAEAAGAIVTRESPLFPDLGSFYEDYLTLLGMSMSRGESPKTADGSGPSAAKLLDHLDRQYQVEHIWATFFEHHDAILMPVYATPAFPHTEEADQTKRTLTIDGSVEPFTAGGLTWASPATYGGMPAAAVPLGLLDGLPIGMQVVTAKYTDHDAIVIGGMLAVPV
jgi:amidase